MPRAARRCCLVAGALAGLGCALKPRYCAVFAVLECLALTRGLRPWRIMPLAAGTTLLGYAGLVAIVCPAYLRRAVPMALALYGATDVSFLTLLADSACCSADGGGGRPAVAAPAQPDRLQPDAHPGGVRRDQHRGLFRGRQGLVLSSPAGDRGDRAGAAAVDRDRTGAAPVADPLAAWLSRVSRSSSSACRPSGSWSRRPSMRSNQGRPRWIGWSTSSGPNMPGPISPSRNGSRWVFRW